LLALEFLFEEVFLVVLLVLADLADAVLLEVFLDVFAVFLGITFRFMFIIEDEIYKTFYKKPNFYLVFL
jgi:hypothetical protein